MSSMFGRTRRTASLPAGVTLAHGERLLASDVTADGSPIAATNHRLVLPTSDGLTSDGLTSVGWAAIERATFDQGSGQLVVTETAPVGSRPRRYRLGMAGALTLLDVIREQVKASVIVSRFVAIDGARGVRVSGRRRPDTGALAWNVTVDAGLDVDNPDIRQNIDAVVAMVRAELP
jgi:hypothetical protein